MRTTTEHLPVQLSLFSADRLRAGEGFEALGRLELERAATMFEETLARRPEACDAQAGLRAARHWQEIMASLPELPASEQAVSLWSAIKQARSDADLLPLLLNTALLEHLLALLDHDGDVVFIPPDLCAGRILLDLGRYREAVQRLRAAVERAPHSAVLRCLIADALWRRGRQAAARAEYVRALLLAPEELLVDIMQDHALRELILTRGRARAAVDGWLLGILPLLEEDDPAVLAAGAACADLYRLLIAAEKARRAGDTEAVLALRRRLREEDPAVLELYVERLS